MKKKLLFILLILILPLWVNAETLKVGENSYSFEELENHCSKAGLELFDYDDKDAICFGAEKLYRVDESGKKIELTNQEYLDYFNSIEDTHYTFYPEENYIYKVTDILDIGYVEVPFEKVDTNKIYATITEDDDGRYSYSFTDDPDYIFDPSTKYYEIITIAYPESAEVKTDGSITYYTCERKSTQICTVVENPKPEDVLNYYVETNETYKEEKVATIDEKLFEELTEEKEGIKYSTLNIYKLPNKDVYYIFYEETYPDNTITRVYTNDGTLVFENVDYFGVINQDLIYTIENDKIVIYNTSKEALKTISGTYLEELFVNDKKNIFRVENTVNKIFEVKKLEEIKEETPKKDSSSDITNPDTGDTIIASLVLGTIALIGLIAVTKHKRKAN